MRQVNQSIVYVNRFNMLPPFLQYVLFGIGGIIAILFVISTILLIIELFKKKINKRRNKMKDKCECGQEVNFKITPFQMNEKRVCPNCGKINYEDKAPIDWERIVKERDYEIQGGR